jgi:hypothetical protein
LRTPSRCVIAHAKIKTDTIDASVLAQLYVSGFLPEVWVPGEPTQALRRHDPAQSDRPAAIKIDWMMFFKRVHSHLIPSCPHADLCGASGRAWLLHQVLPEDERLAVERHLREFDRLGEDLKVIERDLARSALAASRVSRNGRRRRSPPRLRAPRPCRPPGLSSGASRPRLLHAKKLRDLELKAGYKAERGQRGAAHAYNTKSQERRWVEQAETAYARFVTGWNPRGPKRARAGDANEGRQ